MATPFRYNSALTGRARSLRRNMTDSERKLWSRLRGNQLGYYFRRQTPIGNYIVDFVCRKEKLVVEVDGWHHYSRKGLESDAKRDKFLREQGFRVLRFTSAETLANTLGVLDAIYENLKRTDGPSHSTVGLERNGSTSSLP